MNQIDTTEDVRAMAEQMTREELVEALVAEAKAGDEAEAAIEELHQAVATLDAVVSRHEAALEDYTATVLAA